MTLQVDKAIREHLKVFRWSLEVITPEDRAYILPTLLNEFIGEIETEATINGLGSSPIGESVMNPTFASKPIKLWEFNGECPECGAPANHTIRACETGLSYCSRECAQKHVNKKEGGY